MAHFGDADAARQRLIDWRWRGSTSRTFACDSPPDGEAGWIDINLHFFATAAAAQQAVDYFAASRAVGTWLTSAASPTLGDHAAALTGPSTNGTEFTVYASQGPLLIRVTGVSPTGIPFDNVLTVARSVLAANQGGAQTDPLPAPPQPSPPAVLAFAYLPAYLAVNYSECFQAIDRGTYSYRDVVDVLQQVGLSETQADGLGWTDGAYVVFVCEDPPFGRATQLDIIIHQFHDAQQALPHFDRMEVLGENESRDCGSARTLIVCVYGRSDSGSPLSDVHFVLNQVLAAAG